MVWYSHLFQSCSQFVMIHTVKAFTQCQTGERRVTGVRAAGALELLEGPLSRRAPWELRGSNPSALARSRGGPRRVWGPLPCREGVVWVRQVCAGLSHMELEFRVRGMALTQ